MNLYFGFMSFPYYEEQDYLKGHTDKKYFNFTFLAPF